MLILNFEFNIKFDNVLYIFSYNLLTQTRAPVVYAWELKVLKEKMASVGTGAGGDKVTIHQLVEQIIAQAKSSGAGKHCTYALMRKLGDLVEPHGISDERPTIEPWEEKLVGYYVHYKQHIRLWFAEAGVLEDEETEKILKKCARDKIIGENVIKAFEQGLDTGVNYLRCIT